MSEIAIRVEGLGKRYRIGERERYHALRDVLSRAASAPLRLVGRGRTAAPPCDEFWALKDVNFEVKAGEVVGVIGRNGAGKSTLLKILSRITEPTEGEVDIYGRIGSLLEVGTGFHPELTGRENVFLNGAILGMKRQEIVRKFDAIVAFAEVEQFIDTPVKHFSSGMHMRLAFSVAAHLEPEILLVDEVLAVGDAAFQQKCLGKMSEVAHRGRTIVFVSHSLAAVQALCQKAILLTSGRLIDYSSTPQVVQRYLESTAALSGEGLSLSERMDRSGDGSVKLTSMLVLSGDPDGVIRSGSRLQVQISYVSSTGAPIRSAEFFVSVKDPSDTMIFLLDSETTGGLPNTLPPRGSITCQTDPINVTAGRCYLDVGVLKGGVDADYIRNAMHIDVVEDDLLGNGKPPTRNWALCVLKHQWSTS